MQRHSAPTVAAGKPEEPVAKHVTAALRQSAPASKVKLCFLLLCSVVNAACLQGALRSRPMTHHCSTPMWAVRLITDMHCVSVKASRFATPRPSAQQVLQQEPEQKSNAIVKRHSAPGSSKKCEGIQSPTGIMMDSSQDAKTKSLKRQSMPPVARKPLACVSNKVVLKTPGSSVKLPGTPAAGPADEEGETLPNRKRKLVAATATRSTSARTVINDDDDFA